MRPKWRTCSDGKLLKNRGDGWKLYRKVKAGVDINAHVEERKASHQAWLDKRPAYQEFKRLMFAATGSLEKRAHLFMAIEMGGNDADGLWCELGDAGFHLELDEITALCNAYDAMQAEAKQLNCEKQMAQSAAA